MLVPEIALTPQVAALFRARFGSRVAIQHSGLSDGERHDQWHRIRRGDVDVVVGTRSAVFAPLARPGLIVVDEEHDTSYKQEETPRYHGRDVAVMRGKLRDALVVLGSATPSMESFANARAGRYTLVTLRAPGAGPAAGRRAASSTCGRRWPKRPRRRAEPAAASRVWDAGCSAREQARDPAQPARVRHGHVLPPVRSHPRMPQLQRVADRSPATGHCPDVGEGQSATGTVRPAGWRARCHYCNFVRPVPDYLPAVRGALPGARRASAPNESKRKCGALSGRRASRAWTATRFAGSGSLVDVLARFARREIDVLVGTQMIAKGHDFPHVTLVGVISADVGLGLADFRAAERTFQLLTQVAGRAGRGAARRRGRRPDAVPDALQHPPRLHAGLSCVLRQGDRVPAGDALPAARGDGQRRRAGPTFDAAMEAAPQPRRRRPRRGAAADSSCSARRRRR